MKTELEELVARHEGYRKFPYRCPKGKLTIGYGYNLDAGMPEDEALALLRVRLGKLKSWCESTFPWFNRLSDCRKRVIISMAYQLGEGGLMGFKRMLHACSMGDFNDAAEEMLISKWAQRDTPERARELAGMMRRG